LGAASSAAAFPYVVASAALGKAGGVAASERITLGCIGVGDHGTKVNLKNFLGNSDAQVVAVCDVDEGRRDNAKGMVNARYSNGGCAAYTDFREIIEREDIDAVVISTPDHWHALMSVMAAKTGKDVFCEKPTLTVEEGRIVSDTIRRYDRVFQTASGVRARGTYHRMCELARNGYLGKLFFRAARIGREIRHLCRCRRICIMICGWVRRRGRRIRRTGCTITGGGFWIIQAGS